MKLLKKLGMILAALAVAISTFIATMDEAKSSTTAVIPTPQADTWTVEQAYKVGSPNGKKYVCTVGEWLENIPTENVSLTCVEWNDPKSYMGLPSGELKLVE